ncbi:adenosine deaminase [Marinibaculum pumilum]|uniref:adenosine deaminase n=1 Tax=Marinibaculum pumilum TaxID=1766165 RepID=A0ABV7L8G6_9PROT
MSGKILRSAAMALAVAVLAAGCTPAQMQAPATTAQAGRAAAAFAAVKEVPPRLRMFLQAFPKGGDLHNHLSGAVYAEDFVDWALQDGTCFDLESLAASAPPCDAKGGRPALKDAIAKGQTSRDAVVDAWSMRNYVPGISAASGHQQFFRTFPRFDPATEGRRGDELVAAIGWAADENTLYQELMTSPQMWPAQALAARVVPDDVGDEDFAAQYEILMKAGLADLVPKARAELDAAEAELRRHYGCPGSGDPACDIGIRYLAQVIRTLPPKRVFAQSLLGFLLAQADPRVVGVNLVAPEDTDIVLKTYSTQMRQLGWLGKNVAPVPVALHAGELTLGLVPPPDLRFHIREAIELAGARRIGHGVDISYETDADGILRRMAEQPVAIEIQLTSNEVILGVAGKDHPFDTYRAYGVPVTLNTDDAGVSRNDLTDEYWKAVQRYDLSYDDILRFSRNGLTYSFLEGESLWADPVAFVPVAACAGAVPGADAPPPACATFLAANRKAALQWRLEERLAAFATEAAKLADPQ